MGTKSKIINRLFLLLMLFISCKENLPERKFISSDEVTGGFFKFTLELKHDEIADLNINIAVATEQSKSGVAWELYNNTINGRWFMDGKTIKCILDKSKISFDSNFIRRTLNCHEKPMIAFSSRLDTAYVYGIPCPLVGMSKK